MLSRTADNLYWMARYMERADFLARIIEASQRLASMPESYAGSETVWESALHSSGAFEIFEELKTEINENNVIDFLTFSTANPSSIRQCIELARSNARAVRTALTTEMWEAINTAYLELPSFDPQSPLELSRDRDAIRRFIEFTKRAALDLDGAAYRTMLRDDAYSFTRLGLYLERADNTARLLDVKYHMILPENEEVGGSLDYFQWSSVLRAVSAQNAYHWVYRDGIKPWLVADLLILKKEMPRSLIASYDNIVRFLTAIGRAHGRQGPSQRYARRVMNRLEQSTIKDIFQGGLHEFIETFVQDNDQLSAAITEQYLLG